MAKEAFDWNISSNIYIQFLKSAYLSIACRLHISPFRNPTVDLNVDTLYHCLSKWGDKQECSISGSLLSHPCCCYCTACFCCPLPPSLLKLKHADFDIVWLLCAISIHTTSFLALVYGIILDFVIVVVGKI